MGETDSGKTFTEYSQRESLQYRAGILAKWIWVLFWLVVPSTIAAILKTDQVKSLSPGIYLFGQILNVVCTFAYGAILLKLSSVESRYRTAAIYGFISAAVGILLLIIISGATKAPAWSLLITLLGTVFTLIRDYNEYSAHAFVLRGADDELSAKWTALWKWSMRCTLGLIGGLVLALVAPILALILCGVAYIGLSIVSVAKLVYLHRTAMVFKEYSADRFSSK